MYKGDDLDRKVPYVTIRHLNIKYLEMFFFSNRISLDLNYSRLAGTSLTVITEMLTLKVKGFEIFIRLCNSTPR